MVLGVTEIPDRSTALNPVPFIESAYSPGSRFWRLKRPLASVVSSLVCPVPTFLAVTWTPGTTAPVGSVTTPTIDPYKACARAACGSAADSSKAHPIATKDLILTRDERLRTAEVPIFLLTEVRICESVDTASRHIDTAADLAG